MYLENFCAEGNGAKTCIGTKKKIRFRENNSSSLSVGLAIFRESAYPVGFAFEVHIFSGSCGQQSFAVFSSTMHV